VVLTRRDDRGAATADERVRRDPAILAAMLLAPVGGLPA